MNELAQQHPHLPAMSIQGVAAVRRLETVLKQQEQIRLSTHHVIHGGMYHRTICIPAGAVLTGVLIKVPTTLVFHGDATVFTGSDEVRLAGHHVLPASAGRKQAFIAHADTWLTMSFPTSAQTVEGAEAQFTDEADLLLSRDSASDVIVITGE